MFRLKIQVQESNMSTELKVMGVGKSFRSECKGKSLRAELWSTSTSIN